MRLRACVGLRTVETWLTRALGITLSLPVEALVLLAIPSNVGRSESFIDLPDGMRFEQRPGAVFGRLLEFKKDDTDSSSLFGSKGQWVTCKNDVIKVDTPNGFAILTPQERDNFIVPGKAANALPPSVTPALTPPLIDPNTGTSYPSETGAMPSILITPIPEQPTIQDLIIEARNPSEQRGFRNNLLDEIKLQNPDFTGLGYEAHHIVPLYAYPQLTGLRDRLIELGIDVNSTENGVLLPTKREFGPETLHSDTQRNEEYQREVLLRFGDVNTRDGAIERLQEIKEELKNGTFIRPRKDKP